jgi:hypothetical protein
VPAKSDGIFDLSEPGLCIMAETCCAFEDRLLRPFVIGLITIIALRCTGLRNVIAVAFLFALLRRGTINRALPTCCPCESAVIVRPEY